MACKSHMRTPGAFAFIFAKSTCAGILSLLARPSPQTPGIWRMNTTLRLVPEDVILLQRRMLS